MTTKNRKTCSTDNGRHSWKFVGNVTLKSESIASFRMRHVGALRCVHCKLTKEGQALKGAKELTFKQLHRGKS
jgi:hypothetical protein